MVPSFFNIIQAVLVVFACVWLKAAFRQLPAEIQKFRKSDNPVERQSQIIAWALSGSILFIAVWFVFGLFVTIVNGLTI